MKRTTNIIDISEKYAFDSTTIPLCLEIFSLTKLQSKKGKLKIYVL